MYCPTCSTLAAEGAKFCKSCGLNLSVVTQALNGGAIVSDPVRDREYKRARKQISDGIHGAAIGAAFLIAAALVYFLVTRNNTIYVVSLSLALAGLIKFFRSVGTIVDAKVGVKLLDPALQPRSTGGLSASQSLPSSPSTGRLSQRLGGEAGKTTPPAPATRPVSLESPSASYPHASPLDSSPPIPGSRVNREHSSPLRSQDRDDEFLSKLRN